MSLINEALKKAQRLRAEQTAQIAVPPVPGGTSPGRIAKRGRAMPAQTLVLLIGAAAVLIVLSVVITGYFLTRTPEPAPPHLAPKVAKPIADLGAPSPVIVAPVVTVPQPEPEPTAPSTAVNSGPAPSGPATTLVAAKTPPVTQTAASTTPPPSVVASKPTPKPPADNEPAAATPAAPKPNPEIQAYVDALRITGVRFSGSDSKVLMNERVFRVNDIVNYTLNLRLQKVAADSVTFVDANGITYVKYF